MDRSNIDHPKHYNIGTIEVIAAIEDWNLGFHLGNALKYIARAPYKGREREDLEKALWYVQRAMEVKPITVVGGRHAIDPNTFATDWKLDSRLRAVVVSIATRPATELGSVAYALQTRIEDLR